MNCPTNRDNNERETPDAQDRTAQCHHHRPAGQRRRPGRRGPEGSRGKGEGRLDIIAWPGYIERGQTDKNYDWVTQFEKETGCAVNVKTAATSDEMVSLMAKGGYDLVTASGDASLRLIFGKRVQPINPR